MKYTREWESLTEMMGYWVDTTDPYITYDNALRFTWKPCMVL